MKIKNLYEGHEYDKTDPQQLLAYHMEEALKIFANNPQLFNSTISGDHPLGTCFVMFHGNKEQVFNIVHSIREYLEEK